MPPLRLSVTASIPGIGYNNSIVAHYRGQCYRALTPAPRSRGFSHPPEAIYKAIDGLGQPYYCCRKRARAEIWHRPPRLCR